MMVLERNMGEIIQCGSLFWGQLSKREFPLPFEGSLYVTGMSLGYEVK